MTPSHVKTNLCTFCNRTFLLKLAKDQQTLNNDKEAATVFISKNAVSASDIIVSESESFMKRSDIRYSCNNSIGAAWQNPC